MTTPGLFLIRDNIFGHLSFEDLETCCKVSDSWNESLNKSSSLKRQSLVKYLLEYGGNLVTNHEKPVEEWKKVYEVIPGWNKAVKKVGSKATLDDLKEIKESLRFYESDKICHGNLVFWVVEDGDLKLMELLLETSYDMNSPAVDAGVKGNYNVLMEACSCSIQMPKCRNTEMVRLIITASKGHRIDLNMRDLNGHSAFQLACQMAPFEVPKFLLENYKEFNIDIMHGDKHGLTAVDHLEWRIDDDMAEEEGVEKWEEFKSILEAEYAKIDLSTA